MKSMKKANVKGFTLIEIMIVVAVIGVMLAVFAPMVTRAFTGSANSLAYKSVADNLNKTYTMLITEAGTGVATTSSALLGNAANEVLDILVNGNNPAGLIATDYEKSFERAGVKPMLGTVTVETAPTVGVPGVYSFSGHEMDFDVAADGTATVTFDGVVSSEIETLFEKYSSGTFDPAAAQASGPIQWDAAAADGTHTLTIQSQI